MCTSPVCLKISKVRDRAAIAFLRKGIAKIKGWSSYSYRKDEFYTLLKMTFVLIVNGVVSRESSLKDSCYSPLKMMWAKSPIYIQSEVVHF